MRCRPLKPRCAPSKTTFLPNADVKGPERLSAASVATVKSPHRRAPRCCRRLSHSPWHKAAVVET
jgi:hypothetical protein